MSALASRDRLTADSALENQSRRVGARFAMILDSDGRTLAAADSPPPGLEERVETLNLLIALIVARSLGKPVLSLAQYAKAIGDGESPEPPPVRVGGELAELRHTLGDMPGKLRDREEQIRYAASHEEITGLPNAHAFLNSVREGFLNGRAYRLFGLRVSDLSNINDTLGLAFGDQVLRSVADRLKHELSAQACHGRWQPAAGGSPGSLDPS